MCFVKVYLLTLTLHICNENNIDKIRKKNNLLFQLPIYNRYSTVYMPAVSYEE